MSSIHGEWMGTAARVWGMQARDCATENRRVFKKRVQFYVITPVRIANCQFTSIHGSGLQHGHVRAGKKFPNHLSRSDAPLVRIQFD